jgi:UDP-glucuronate 4-epimerase
MLMNILVTGSAGFIGSHLALSLLKDGHHVVGLDNFNDYYTVQLKRDRHTLLTVYPTFTGLEQDLCDHEALMRCFQQHQFDCVCHLAAQAGVRYSLDHPFVYEKANLDGFLSILEAYTMRPLASYMLPVRVFTAETENYRLPRRTRLIHQSASTQQPRKPMS